jgi:PleD family two-component response regulator
VRHLVELHGGTAWARVPARIRVRSSRSTAGDDRERTESPEEFKQPRCAKSKRAIDSLRRLQGLRVLVVDDEIDARTLLTTMLERCGAQVVAVGSSREGLESSRELEPDVLIADIGCRSRMATD